MTTAAARPWTFPTRDKLRGVSRWVWVLVALAALFFLVYILEANPISAATISRAAFGACPILVAAALMAVAPRQRLVVLSALGFVASPTVQLAQLAFSGDIHDVLRMPVTTYSDLQQQVLAVTGALDGLGWLFSLVAILGLAFYIGTVKSQRGWWIVGIGVALAAVRAVVSITSFWSVWTTLADSPDFQSVAIQQFAGTLLYVSALVAWAYLTAVSMDRRMVLLPVAGGIHLVQSAVGIAWLGVALVFPPDPTTGLGGVDSVVFYLFNLAFWPLLVLGILRELARAPAEGTSTGR